MLQGVRRYGSEEAEAIDWINSPTAFDGSSRSNSGHTAAVMSEMFAYHATTMANTIRSPLVVFTRKVGGVCGANELLKDCPCVCGVCNAMLYAWTWCSGKFVYGQ